MFDSDFDLVLR